jgi:uncharacterized membrane protein YphA (DoxX/SURF4 family)
MLWAFLIGRVLVGAYFLYNGINHFVSHEGLTAYAASRGVPAPGVAVVGSGLLLLVAGFCFVSGWRPRIGVVAAVLFFVPVTLMMHRFWAMPDAAASARELVQFTKNFAIMGATLVFLGVPEPWPASLDARRRERRTSPAATTTPAVGRSIV